jgi:hypothetical protein
MTRCRPIALLAALLMLGIGAGIGFCAIGPPRRPVKTRHRSWGGQATQSSEPRRTSTCAFPTA